MKNLKSGFVFFGNAAIYIQTFLSILIPYFFDKNGMTKSWKYFNVTVIFLSICFLISTARISVVVTFFLSLFLMLLFNKSIKNKLTYLLCFILGFLIFSLLMPELICDLYDRFYLRIVKRDSSTLEGSFFIQNFKSSIFFISKYFFFGAGLGMPTFKIGSSTFVLHGTYFKLFAETGLFSFLAYLSIMYKQVYAFMINKKFTYAIFFLGILFSSIYNDFHVRLEFWIYLAIISFIFDEKIC